MEKTKKQELCLKCKECCKIIAVRAGINPENERTVDFYTTRGCRVLTTEQLPIVLVPYPCPYLTEEGCKIYTTRPLACKEYDGRLDPIMRHICLWNELEEDNG